VKYSAARRHASDPALQGSGITGEPSPTQRRRFVEALERFAAAPGSDAAAWAGLRCYRSARPTPPNPTLYSPAICIVAQGAKQATLGERVFRYDPFHYLVITAPMPVQAWVIEASEHVPYLSMSLDVDTSTVHELLLEMEEAVAGNAPVVEEAPPLRVSRLDARLLDAVVRFLDAVADPLDRKILAPAAAREILYLALLRDQGDLIRYAARRDGRSRGIDRALQFIRQHLEDRIDVPAIAREAGMSTSSLHHGFKSATTLTPIQYLKRMRLHRARQLMADEGCLAAEAAFRVGYESPSQFSREFKRLFGQPPRRYLENRSEIAGA
jgi:AraC-like DNA-binding protein